MSTAAPGNHVWVREAGQEEGKRERDSEAPPPWGAGGCDFRL